VYCIQYFNHHHRQHHHHRHHHHNVHHHQITIISSIILARINTVIFPPGLTDINMVIITILSYHDIDHELHFMFTILVRMPTTRTTIASPLASSTLNMAYRGHVQLPLHEFQTFVFTRGS